MNRDELRKRWGVHSADSNVEADTPSSVSGSNDNALPKSQYYAAEPRHEYIASLKIIRRDGHILYLPYSHQPIIEYIPDEGIYIKTMQQEVRITGRGLAGLADWLGAQRVTWIKQSSTGIDDENKDMFVEDIEITAL